MPRTIVGLALSVFLACGHEPNSASDESREPTRVASTVAGSAAPAAEPGAEQAPVSDVPADPPAAESAARAPDAAEAPGGRMPDAAEAPAARMPDAPAAAPSAETPPPSAQPAEPHTNPAEFSETCDEVHVLRSHAADDATRPFVVEAGQEVHARIPVVSPWGTDPVQLIQMRPRFDNTKILHHVTLVTTSDQILAGITPGRTGSVPLPADVGIDLPGQNLALDLHYYNVPGTQAESDASGIALCILREHRRPNTATLSQVFVAYDISIPPRVTQYRVESSCRYDGTQPVQLISAGPHAHRLANHVRFTLKKRGGRTIVMHDAAYDFNEQNSYALPQPVELAPGDVVSTTCTYDNPTDRTVVYGQDTGDEMCFNFALFYPMGPMSCTTLN